MNNDIEADYQVVEERTPETIRAEIKTIEAQVYKTTLDGVIQIGNRLRELKDMIGHGNWLTWCKESLGYSDRQARRYIEISEEYGNEKSAFSNWKMSSNLSISKAYSLLALPEEEVESFAENHDVENLTVKELEAEIKDWKQKNEDLKKEKENVQAEMETARKERETLLRQIDDGEVRRLELVEEIEELKERKADPEEIEKLRKKLDKEKETVKDLKERLKQGDENRQRLIDDALAKQKDRMKKEAEEAQAQKVKEAEELRRAAERQTEALKKKLEQSGNEEIIRFKLKTDQLQEDFQILKNAMETIQSKDAEQAGKLKAALKLIMETLLKQLEG